jgi:serine/threonine-protein kinase
VIDDRELWQRARPLFEQLIDLDDDARRARLHELTRGDSALYALLDTMMRADASADDALAEYSFGLPRVTRGGSHLEATAAAPDPLGILGQTIAHFRVTAHVASGGMGAVYAAEDLQLGRAVALKFPLPHEHTDHVVQERFLREARSAAALDHPNLCSVYEVGESAAGVFLAMPLYAGETLRHRLARERRLTPGDTIAIARDVVRGLAAAHAAGIVHRDLKPGNIMLAPDGTAKIFDFGLAKMRDVSVTGSVTQGTVVYMAPDQLRGGRADARADLWAVGVMLYVMLTGQLPFGGEHEPAILHAILHEQPERPSTIVAGLSAAWDDLVGALLQKNPAHRYQSAEELLEDLQALDSGAALRHHVPLWARAVQHERFARTLVASAALVAIVAIASLTWSMWPRSTGANTTAPITPQRVAVLPFTNRDADAADEFLVAGFTEQVIALLGHQLGNRVAGSASAAALRKQGLAPAVVGEKLGAANVVEGSIRVQSDILVVTVQLTRVSDGRSLWSDTLTANVTAMEDIERQVADSIGRILHPGEVRAATRRPTRDFEAHRLYLLGRYAWNQRSQAKLEEAIGDYKGALELDPKFAQAYAGLAAAYVNMVNFRYMPLEEGLANAEHAAEKAIALDSTVADGYAALGDVLVSRGESTPDVYSRAAALFDRAIALNPSMSWAHHYYALLYMSAGRIAQAEDQTRQSLELDTLSQPGNAMLGIELAADDRLLEARDQLQRALKLNRGFVLSQTYLGEVEAALGNDGEAVRLLEAALNSTAGFPGVRPSLAYTYRRLGREAQARRLLRDALADAMREGYWLNYVETLAVLEQTDSAFAILGDVERQQKARGIGVDIWANPLLRRFRSDPRFMAIMPRPTEPRGLRS